jgi:hypothetical protein
LLTRVVARLSDYRVHGFTFSPGGTNHRMAVARMRYRPAGRVRIGRAFSQ